MVGLKVLRDSVEVGVVTAVEHFPAQDLLVIKHGEKDVMVPFVKAIVPSVDLKAGTLTVTPPTGLFEEVLPELATPEPATSDEDEAEYSESEAVGAGIAAEDAE